MQNFLEFLASNAVLLISGLFILIVVILLLRKKTPKETPLSVRFENIRKERITVILSALGIGMQNRSSREDLIAILEKGYESLEDDLRHTQAILERNKDFPI